MNGMKGSDSDILQSNVDGLSASGGAAPNQSSVSRAARLLFTAPTCGVCVCTILSTPAPATAAAAADSPLPPWLALLHLCTRSVPFLSFLVQFVFVFVFVSAWPDTAASYFR